MREGVTYKRLGEVGQVITGSTPPTKDERNYSSNEVCFFKPSDIDSTGLSELNQSEYYISNYAYEHTRKLPKGSILTTCIGIIGKVGILMTDASCNQQINAIIPNADIISSRFLGYAIISIKNTLIQSANAPVVPILTKSLFSNFSIPVPSLSTQELIVRELDSISSVISAKKQQVLELDNLAQAIFLDTFGDPITNPKGWEVKKMSEVATEKLSYGSGASATTYDGSTRYVRITDIKDSGELNDDMVSPSVIDEKYILNDGDILFARSGATVGKTYLHSAENGRCIYAGYLIRLVPNKELTLPCYIFNLTKTEYYRLFIASTQRAVAQPNINAQQYGEFRIPLPPLSLQQAFAEKVQAIEEQKRLINQSIAEFESLLAQRMEFHFA